MKQVIIINGKPGVGKDTLIDFLRKEFVVCNYSTIDFIKEKALELGWDGIKDTKGRIFLAGLKALVVDYNHNIINTQTRKRYKQFLSDNTYDIMFIHIREPKEIERFIKLVKEETSNIKTLLIRGGRNDIICTESDRNVELYDYDFIYNNNLPLHLAEDDFINWVKNKIIGE